MRTGMHGQMGSGCAAKWDRACWVGPHDGNGSRNDGNEPWLRDHGEHERHPRTVLQPRSHQAHGDEPPGRNSHRHGIGRPKVAELIKKHVAEMGQRVEEGRDPGLPIESPALHSIFRDKDKIKRTYETTAKGVIVVQTSTDASYRQRSPGSRCGGERSCPTRYGCDARRHDEERRWHDARCNG